MCLININFKFKKMGISEWIMSIDPTIRAIIGINVVIIMGVAAYFIKKKKEEDEHKYK